MPIMQGRRADVSNRSHLTELAANTEKRRDPAMRGVVIHGPGDVRLEDRDDPTIVDPTDAIMRLSATCVCGSDLLDRPRTQHRHTPHRPRVLRNPSSRSATTLPLSRGGQFVVGSFCASDNTCQICQAGASPTLAETRQLPGSRRRS